MAYKGSQLLGQSSILGKLGKNMTKIWTFFIMRTHTALFLMFIPHPCYKVFFTKKILRRSKLSATDQLCPFLYGRPHPSCKEGNICWVQVRETCMANVIVIAILVIVKLNHCFSSHETLASLFRTGLINLCPVGRSCSYEERQEFARFTVQDYYCPHILPNVL